MKKIRMMMAFTFLALTILFVGGTGDLAKAVGRNPTFTSHPAQTGISKSSVMVTWMTDYAYAFDVYIKEYTAAGDQQDWVYKGRVTDNSVTITGLRSGMNFDVRITAINDEDPSKTSTRTCKAKTLIDTNETMYNVHTAKFDHIEKYATVEWTPMGAADGYEYEFSNYKGKPIAATKLTQSSESSLTFDGLNADATYTFSIRAYMTYEGKKYYTKWKSINVFEQAWVNSVIKKGNSLTIKWNKVSGATGYVVYVSSKPKKGYKKVKSLGKGKTSLTIKKVKKTKISKKKKWYVYVVTKKGSDRSGNTYYWDSSDKGAKFKYL